jgi:hypothetical protein
VGRPFLCAGTFRVRVRARCSDKGTFPFRHGFRDRVPSPHSLSSECSLTLALPLLVSGVRLHLFGEFSFVYRFPAEAHRDVYIHLWVYYIVSVQPYLVLVEGYRFVDGPIHLLVHLSWDQSLPEVCDVLRYVPGEELELGC